MGEWKEYRIKVSPMDRVQRRSTFRHDMPDANFILITSSANGIETGQGCVVQMFFFGPPLKQNQEVP